MKAIYAVLTLESFQKPKSPWHVYLRKTILNTLKSKLLSKASVIRRDVDARTVSSSRSTMRTTMLVCCLTRTQKVTKLMKLPSNLCFNRLLDLMLSEKRTRIEKGRDLTPS